MFLSVYRFGDDGSERLLNLQSELMKIALSLFYLALCLQNARPQKTFRFDVLNVSPSS